MSDPLVITRAATPESLAKDLELAYRNLSAELDTKVSEDSYGTVVLVAGTATVHTTAVTSKSVIFLTGQAAGGTAGELTVTTRTPGKSFVVVSSNGADTRKVGWMVKP